MIQMYLHCNYLFLLIMEVSIIKIGNSKGLRLPKEVLKQYEIEDKVQLVLDKQQIIIKPVKKPRIGWEDAFKNMHNNEDDQLLIDDVFEDETFEEW